MLSVIIITKNEAHNIERCLKSVQWADEIIVVDSGSTDDTIAIASQYTNTILSTDWQGYGVQKQRALSMSKGDWVLNIDADEEVGPELKQAILEVMAANVADAYRIPIRMNFYGKNLCYSSSPTRHIRLFKRDGAKYSNDVVHEKIVLPNNAEISRLSSAITHYCYQNVSHALYKLNQYSSATAQIRLKQDYCPTFVGVLASAGWMFFRSYLLQRGFMDGREGFVLAMFKMEEAYYRGVKQIYPDKESNEL
ncbi:MAG: glycosyl transferase [Legionellales bacterium RIFCSPHIGHO2_12_FULL_42_9]|nr:MAG: glycosyl transferase [Legionellales bacterium RIFCSPHIGHO2_12_FULL_42_9]